MPPAATSRAPSTGPRTGRSLPPDGLRPPGLQELRPRARIIKEAADTILAKAGGGDHLLAIARELEEVALHDPYFVERKLYPNVDFYSGLIYRALGFPVGMFTVLFAIGRLPGWIAQWREMMTDPDARIGRPRQLYIGETQRGYVPIAER